MALGSWLIGKSHHDGPWWAVMSRGGPWWAERSRDWSSEWENNEAISPKCRDHWTTNFWKHVVRLKHQRGNTLLLVAYLNIWLIRKACATRLIKLLPLNKTSACCWRNSHELTFTNVKGVTRDSRLIYKPAMQTRKPGILSWEIGLRWMLNVRACGPCPITLRDGNYALSLSQCHQEGEM